MTKKGVRIPSEINARVVHNEGRSAILMIIRDITERKRAEEALKENAEELKISNAELQQFAYVASHDLQEPLRMIVSYLTLLDNRYSSELDEKAHEYIAYAVDGGERMRELIDDLLEFSRVETRARPFSHVNLNEVADRVLMNLKVQIEENKVDIFIEPLPMVMADEQQMVQLMQNLLGNTIKFHGPERPMVRISAFHNEKEWTIAVKDNGIGMNTQYADKIFQMFQRLHTISEYPGTGVGLAIAKKIVEHHGGRIWVESEEGKGATCLFYHPR